MFDSRKQADNLPDFKTGGPGRWLACAAVAVATFLVVRTVLPDTKAVPLGSPVAATGTASALRVDEAEPSLTIPESSEPLRISQPEPAGKLAAAITLPAGPRTRAPAPAPGNQELAKALVYGTATDDGTEPIADVLLHARTPAGVKIHTKTDPKGRYAIGPLPVGQWTITVHSEGRHCPSIQVGIDLDTQLLRRDLVLPLQQMVRVAVVARDGSPAQPALRSAGLETSPPGLLAVASLARPGAMLGLEHMDLTQTFGVGRPQWRLASRSSLGEDTLTLLAIQTQGSTWVSLVSHHCVLQSMLIHPEVREARFIVEPADLLALRAEVRAWIIDAATGLPLAAKVSAKPGPSSFAITQQAVADRLSGAVTLAGVAPGPCWWIAEADGYATVRRKIMVPRGETLDLGVIALDPPVSLAGSVHSANGKPLECILSVSRIEPSKGPRLAEEIQRSTSGSDGRFRITGLLPAVYVLAVVGTPTRSPYPPDPALRSSPLQVDATGGSVEEILLEASATTRVTFPVSKFEERWPYLEAISANGLVADGTWLGRWFDEAWIDVLPGDYTLEIRRIDGSVFRQELTVNDQPLRLELTVNLEEEQ